MATIYYSLSGRTNKETNLTQVLARFTSTNINLRAKTGIYVPKEYWDVEAQSLTIPKLRLKNEGQTALFQSLNDLNTQLQELRTVIMEAFIQAGAGKAQLPPHWLTSTIDRHLHPENYEIEPTVYTLADGINDYLYNNKLSVFRARQTKVLLRSLLRFEKYAGKRLELDTLSADDIHDFEDYMRHEAEIVETHPRLLDVCKESRTIYERSENTMIARMKLLRAVVKYNYLHGHTENDPFARYSIGECVYGTPYYITLEELHHLYYFDLSQVPALAVQRDIFVFQCLIGCRVSDLMKMTRRNLIDGGIEYIPHKTKDKRPTIVRVPLNDMAAEIVARYEDKDRESLLPFISQQNYNYSIKDAFTLAGLTRPITILDPQTRQEVTKPLNELASSHLARRTFIGNLYKRIKDPNLIAKLSGHTEGSREFARYRDIDEDMKKELVQLLG